MLKWIANITALLLIGAVVAGWLLHSGKETEDAARVAVTGSAVRRIEQVLKLHATTGEAEVNARGFVARVEASWFGKELPVNELLGAKGKRPWLEIAPAEDAERTHPRERQAVRDDLAAFWYNPGNGVVRARVPVMVSDEQATAAYNAINQTNLASIFDDVPLVNGER